MYVIMGDNIGIRSKPLYPMVLYVDRGKHSVCARYNVYRNIFESVNRKILPPNFYGGEKSLRIKRWGETSRNIFNFIKIKFPFDKNSSVPTV